MNGTSLLEMERVNGTRRLAALSLASALVFATGCGGDDDSAATTTESPAPSPTGTDEGDPEYCPARVIQAEDITFSILGGSTARVLGMFEEAGLEIEHQRGEAVVEALASGDADIALSSFQFVAAIVAGAESKLIGPGTDEWNQFLIVHPDSDVESVQDFTGGDIGVSRIGAAGHYSAARLAADLGLDESDYNIVPVGSLSALIAALETGQIDAFAWTIEAAVNVEADGHGRIVGSVGEVIPPAPVGMIAASDDFIERCGPTVRAYCEVYYEAQNLLRDDHDAAVDMLVEHFDRDPERTRVAVELGVPDISQSSEFSNELLQGIADATNFTIEGVDDLTADDIREMVVDCASL